MLWIWRTAHPTNRDTFHWHCVKLSIKYSRQLSLQPVSCCQSGWGALIKDTARIKIPICPMPRSPRLHQHPVSQDLTFNPSFLLLLFAVVETCGQSLWSAPQEHYYWCGQRTVHCFEDWTGHTARRWNLLEQVDCVQRHGIWLRHVHLLGSQQHGVQSAECFPHSAS